MLIERIDAARLEISPLLDSRRRSKLGQFMTPGRIARAMASEFASMDGEIRLLDAGAGMGVLTAAFVEEACRRPLPPTSIDCTCHEVDPVLVAELRHTLERCADMCRASNVGFSSRIVADDYILGSAEPLLRSGSRFTHAIMNPPYAKLGTSSAWRIALRSLGIETVNLYAAFVAVALGQLVDGGELVAITPRSFCNGPYYKPFRRQLLSHSALLSVHLFESRKTAFKDDEVLQENIIFHLRKGDRQGPVRMMTDGSEVRKVAFETVVQPDDPEQFIRLGGEASSNGLGARMGRLPATLKDLGMTVSTGRVVDFRASDHLRAEPGEGTVPLIYPGHFDGSLISWPREGFRKSNALADCEATQALMVPAGAYVLTKRFSAKEERRRLVAAVYDGPKVGFENHLNYFHRKGEGLDRTFARGLSAFLNSTAADRHFREFSGHTQVNATDLRNMRYPSETDLMALGEMELPDQTSVDEAVERLV